MSINFAEPLLIKTPEQWGLFVINDLQSLLSDHAYCERKAAGFALGLLQKYGHFYPEHSPLSKLIREEMRHYELVLKILANRNLALVRLTSGGYARYLRAQVVEEEPIRHVQLLIIAALIEARSCERFEVLAQVLGSDEQALATFYHKLALAERRHHLLYLTMASKILSANKVQELLFELSNAESDWLQANPLSFHMHSGLLSS